jgi:hypothetical protein
MKIEIIKKWIVMEIRSKQNRFFFFERKSGRKGGGRLIYMCVVCGENAREIDTVKHRQNSKT